MVAPLLIDSYLPAYSVAVSSHRDLRFFLLENNVLFLEFFRFFDSLGSDFGFKFNIGSFDLDKTDSFYVIRLVLILE